MSFPNYNQKHAILLEYHLSITTFILKIFW